MNQSYKGTSVRTLPFSILQPRHDLINNLNRLLISKWQRKQREYLQDYNFSIRAFDPKPRAGVNHSFFIIPIRQSTKWITHYFLFKPQKRQTCTNTQPLTISFTSQETKATNPKRQDLRNSNSITFIIQAPTQAQILQQQPHNHHTHNPQTISKPI